MPGDQLLGNRQPEAGSVGPAGDQRIEEAVAQVDRHARSVILEGDAGDDAMGLGADRHVRQHAGTDVEAPLAADGLHGVAPEVEDRLDQLIAVDGQRRQAGVVVPLDRQARRRVRLQQAEHVLDRLVQVERYPPRRGTRSEQPVDQRHEPVGFADDHTRVLAQGVVRQFARQELRGAPQATERILDLVRQTLDHQPAAADLRQQLRIARATRRQCLVHQFEQHLAIGKRGNRAVGLDLLVGAARR